jgi:hypothetical protein
MHQKVQKTRFREVPRGENFDKKFSLYRKEPEKIIK